MARPLQTGLNYFPMDVTFDQDDKIALIEADFGLEGFSITVKLLMKIYSESYFYPWGKKEQKLFARRVGGRCVFSDRHSRRRIALGPVQSAFI